MMKPRIAIAMASLLALPIFSACRSPETTTSQARPARIPAIEGEAVTPADAIILDRIRLNLSSARAEVEPVTQELPIRALLNMHVTVSHGVVTLRGLVDSYEMKRGIEARVHSAKGVQLVRNELRVARPDGFAK